MERRGQNRDIGMPNSTSYNHPQITQESPVKLPLAPIVSTPSDRRGNSAVSTRRGSAIFSPTQTLNHHLLPPQNHQSLNSPPPPPPPQKDPTPDPDPATPSTGGAPPPPPRPQPQVQPPPPPLAASSIRYRECLKNHAASTGGHVVDGCGEFMPSGEEGTAEELRCAACDCHRNFHRKEVDGEPQHRTPLLHGQNPPSMMPHHHQKRSQSYPTPPTMVNFGGTSGGAAAGEQSSSEDLNTFQSGGGGHAVMQPSKKRFRTKFSQHQKDRMQEFAEKIGWRIQKQDEEEVQRFCNETGVKRQVFKVWMHNNKQAMKKRQT
ncbi:hypothetical protein CDL12_01306 [Handroanthus impetiginosus]|uniref:ZF-HD dimerization-type domain-containing protein n=1 Tax=Handroanthus impetiginosus TaxID=429701 RepID=A0A2G9I8I6_9LAMI|nr:hypothetical protein CDL12_01306 [Handroanthus impetiginosus]